MWFLLTTMQSYGEFRLFPNNRAKSSSTCCDTIRQMRQTALTPQNPVAQKLIFPNLFCSIKRIPSVSPSNRYSLKRHKARYLCEPYMCLINQLTKIMKFISNIKFNSNFIFWWCKGCSACLSEGKGKTIFGWFQRFAMNLLRDVATEWRVCDKGENRGEILSQAK